LHGSGVTWAVFVYLLAHADRAGTVEVIPQAIADDTGFSVEQVREAITELESPDTASRSADDDGRRIRRLDEHRDWGWSVVNYEKYRGLRDQETLLEQQRERKRKQRERVSRTVTQVTPGHALSHQVTPGPPLSLQAEAEAEAEGEEDSQKIATSVADVIGNIATGMSLNRRGPLTPLMRAVKPEVEALPGPEQARVYALAGWLGKSGMDDECILRIVADAIPRLETVRSLHGYYSRNGPARTTIEGHYRADLQERESAHWRQEDWDWVRKLKARQEAADG
jgi:DNA-binding transcriptional MerR regulator